MAFPMVSVERKAVSLTQLEQALLIGSDNKDYMPCIFEHWTGDIKGWGITISSSGGTDAYPFWKLPLRTTIGSLKLYIDSVRLELYVADNNNYVSTTTVYGQTYTTLTSILAETTDRKAQGQYDSAITLHDCSVYSYVGVQLFCVLNADEGLKIANVALRSYYA